MTSFQFSIQGIENNLYHGRRTIISQGRAFLNDKVCLSEDEITSYHRDGLVIPDYRFPDDVLAQMRAAYDDILATNKGRTGIDPDFMLGPHLDKPGAQGVIGNKAWLDFARHPDIINMVAQIAGEDLILWGTTLFGKPAYTGKATAWHQDGDYYPIEPLETITVWIALDDSSRENGCMRYIPGSHKERRLFPHHWDDDPDLNLRQVIDEEYSPENQARDIELKAGQLSIHDIYLVHGSRANTSPRRRAGFVLRIMPGSSYYNHHKGSESGNDTHDYSGRALFLLRGRDQTGRNDFGIGH